MNLRLGAVASLVAVVALTGCDAQLHPGDAAVVNGTSISQDDVDDVVTAVCNYIEIANKSAEQPSNPAFSDLRSSFLGLLIQFDIVSAVTSELGLTIYPADIEKAAQFPLPDELSQEDQDIINDYLYQQAESQVGQATIAAHETDSGVTNSTGVTIDPNSPPPDAVQQALADADVSVNPGFGSWDGTTVTTSSGSLSDLVSTPKPTSNEGGASAPTDTGDLPPSQVCG